MDHPRPANHDPPVVATVAAVMAAVVAIGAAIVPVPVVVATAISVVVVAAVVDAMATVVVAGRCRGGHRPRHQGGHQGCELQGGMHGDPPSVFELETQSIWYGPMVSVRGCLVAGPDKTTKHICIHT